MTPLSTGVPLAERYLLLEQLGAGGMSVVWRSYDDVLGRPVAVKVLSAPTAADPAFRAAIRKEARASARLSHPNIIQVYDYGEATLPDGASVSYVVMELLDGQTLASRLAGGALPWREAVAIAAQVAQALAAAHRRGIVHRDIAPANVMLTATGAKVLDFGIAALAGGRGDPDGGGLLGTPAYVAPERLDDAPAAPAADVYALGALLYELLTGAPPVPAKTWPALVEAYREGPPAVAAPHVDGLPSAVAELCLRCLATDPAGRPGTADAARILAEALAPDEPPAAPGTGRAVAALAPTRLLPAVGSDGRAPVPASRLPALLVAVAVVLLLAATAVIIAVHGTGRRHVTGDAPAPGPAPGAVTSGTPSPVPAGTQSATAAAPPGGGGGPRGSGSATPAAPPLAIVDSMIATVRAGASAGEIREDVAQDLENVLGQLRQQVMSGQAVDYGWWSGTLRTKVAQRASEQAITDSYAQRLLSDVDALSHSTT